MLGKLPPGMNLSNEEDSVSDAAKNVHGEAWLYPNGSVLNPGARGSHIDHAFRHLTKEEWDSDKDPYKTMAKKGFLRIGGASDGSIYYDGEPTHEQLEALKRSADKKRAPLRNTDWDIIYAPTQSDNMAAARRRIFGMANSRKGPLKESKDANSLKVHDFFGSPRKAGIVNHENKLYDVSQIGHRALHDSLVIHSPQLFGVNTKNTSASDALNNGSVRFHQYENKIPHIQVNGDVKSPRDVLGLIYKKKLPKASSYDIFWGDYDPDQSAQNVPLSKLHKAINWEDLKPTNLAEKEEVNQRQQSRGKVKLPDGIADIDDYPQIISSFHKASKEAAGYSNLPIGMQLDNDGLQTLQDLASSQYPDNVTRVTHKDGQECHHQGKITLPNGKQLDYEGIAYGKDGSEGVAVHRLLKKRKLPPGMRMANLEYSRVGRPGISWAAAHRGEVLDGHVVEPFDGVACANDNKELQPIPTHYHANPVLFGDESRLATLISPDNKVYDISQTGRRPYHEQAVNHSPHLFGADPDLPEYDQLDHAISNGTIRVQQGWNTKRKKPVVGTVLHFDGNVRSPSDIVNLIDNEALPDDRFYTIGWGGANLGNEAYEPVVSQTKLRNIRDWKELKPQQNLDSARFRMFGMDNDEGEEIALSDSRPCLNLLFGDM